MNHIHLFATHKRPTPRSRWMSLVWRLRRDLRPDRPDEEVPLVI